MTREERLAIYQALSAPFPPEAIERSSGEQTGRGYDTSGIKAQFVIDRLNEVLGVGGYHVVRTSSCREIKRSTGRIGFEATSNLTLQLGEWQGGTFTPFAESVSYGGHSANSEGDALKGAATNALKRAAALLGCGREAYAGTIDDDNTGAPLAAPRRGPVGRNVERAAPVSGASSSPSAAAGRVTGAQLGKMRSLVAERGGDWAKFKAGVKERHGVVVEYLDRSTASDIIDRLLTPTRPASNGASHGGSR